MKRARGLKQRHAQRTKPEEGSAAGPSEARQRCPLCGRPLRSASPCGLQVSARLRTATYAYRNKTQESLAQARTVLPVDLELYAHFQRTRAPASRLHACLSPDRV